MKKRSRNKCSIYKDTYSHIMGIQKQEVSNFAATMV